MDNILASLLRNFKNLVYKYHEHESLLENNAAEDLNEQEKADAWEAYEKDVSMKSKFFPTFCFVTVSKLNFFFFLLPDQFGNVSKTIFCLIFFHLHFFCTMEDKTLNFHYNFVLKIASIEI